VALVYKGGYFHNPLGLFFDGARYRLITMEIRKPARAGEEIVLGGEAGFKRLVTSVPLGKGTKGGEHTA